MFFTVVKSLLSLTQMIVDVGTSSLLVTTVSLAMILFVPS
jgi:hypothetical protein